MHRISNYYKRQRQRSNGFWSSASKAHECCVNWRLNKLAEMLKRSGLRAQKPCAHARATPRGCYPIQNKNVRENTICLHGELSTQAFALRVAAPLSQLVKITPAHTATPPLIHLREIQSWIVSNRRVPPHRVRRAHAVQIQIPRMFQASYKCSCKGGC